MYASEVLMSKEAQIWSLATAAESINKQVTSELTHCKQNGDRELLKKAYQYSNSLSATLNELHRRYKK